MKLLKKVKRINLAGSIFRIKEVNEVDSFEDIEKILSENLEVKEEEKYGASVQKGKIIIKSSTDIEKEVTIKSCKGITLFINGINCSDGEKHVVNELDDITYISEKINFSKSALVKVDKDKMKAYLSIKYIPEYEYKLLDIELKSNVTLKAVKVANKFKDSDKYSIEQAINILRENKICFGINIEYLKNAINSEDGKPVLIAEGIKVVDDVPAKVNYLFQDKHKIDISGNERVDYKEWYSFDSVKKGDVIAEIIPRIEGKDGRDVFGKEIKRNHLRDEPVRTDNNCHLENNKVIADIDGRPSNKNGIISIFNSYEIKDVDLKTGNVNFSGDVIVGKSVKEGMTVKSGNTLFVGGGVYSSKLFSNGEITIRGNVIDSIIISGEVDIIRKKYINLLKDYNEKILLLIQLVDKLLKKYPDKKIGELVNMIIEQRIKDFQKLSINIVSFNISRELKSSPIVEYIRSKILGLNLLNLSSLMDIRYLQQIVEAEIEYWDNDTLIPININIKYCQNSRIKSTGDIIISGEGEYNSRLHSLNNIKFENMSSSARGGVIKAEGNIEVGKVGSLGNVITRLEVAASGRVKARIAYTNTIIKVGNQERVIDEPCKNLEAYLDDNGEICIIKSPL